MTDLFSIDGKSVVVTGGARGLGAHLSRGLVAAGAHVVVVSRDGDACRRRADELSTVGTCHAVPADVTSPDGRDRIVEALGEVVGGSLDVLVNNAGVTWGAPLESFPTRAWDQVVQTNVTAVFDLTVALLPALRAAASPDDPSRIINVGSVDGLRVPSFENYSYSASKAAVHHLTRHLAHRLARDHVTVNAIAPGAFLSDMTAFALGDADTADQIVASIPLRRLGAADDLVGATTFLSSRAGAYVTGVVLPVDGGIAGA